MSYAGSLARVTRQRGGVAGDIAIQEDCWDSDRDAPAGGDQVATQEIDLRQLRHHTKNTLQRIIGLIGEIPGLHTTPEGRQAAQELERRICLSATISNALFGFTDAPGSMTERLRRLAGPMVDMMRSAEQTIHISVSARGTCPAHLRQTVMRTAHELIGNTMKHGMKRRARGRIRVRLVCRDSISTLTVADDGQGFDGVPKDGEGLTLVRSLAAAHGGSLYLKSFDGTTATIALPHRL